jgi:small subunit ribosomal protein S16
MSVRIRLTRHGAKKRPFYRIVVSDARSSRNGKIIEQVGTYDPQPVSGGVKLNAPKVEAWLKRGAQPSQTVKDLIKRARRDKTS